MAAPVVKCFISHTSKDIAAVRELCAALSRGDDEGSVKLWYYEDDLNPGRDLERLKSEIAESDFFIIALSEDAMRSGWVQRELGFANGLHKKSGGTKPIILGVCVSKDPPDAYLVPMKDFDTGEQVGSYDFSKSRYWKLYRPETDAIETLAKFIRPRVRFWGIDIHEDEELFRLGTFDVYEQLFPNEEERDHPADIVDWLKSEHSTVSPEFKPGTDKRTPMRRILNPVHEDWGSVFAVLEIAGRAVGFAYLTVHVRSGWAFGNYFGVLEAWRVHGRAAFFIDEVKRVTERSFGKLKGVVFEVECYTEPGLRKARAALQAETAVPDGASLETIRAVLRIMLYQHNGAVLLTDRRMHPLSYRQPAMNDLGAGERLTKTWLSRKEWPLWLMILPLSLTKTDSYDLVDLSDFIYFGIFGSYAPAREQLFRAHGLSYWRYLVRLRSEFLKQNGKKALGVRQLKSDDRSIWMLARKREFPIKL
ncbi:MAG: TIR domain-containing protein [Alphaproteobacteria bacterium]|nr:TIR domain-containing protein [Alphaproteobacteria bacterium]